MLRWRMWAQPKNIRPEGIRTYRITRQWCFCVICKYVAIAVEQAHTTLNLWNNSHVRQCNLIDIIIEVRTPSAAAIPNLNNRTHHNFA